MKVKDVIISALNNLGRQSVADTVSSDGTLDGEATETVNTLLYCFNAVEDEVARCYLPLRTEQKFTSSVGQFAYTKFSKTPVRIRRVLKDGKEIPFKLYPLYLGADATEVTVEYEYSPSKKALADTSDFLQGVIGEYAFACGVAAEYCLINGEVEAAELWENRYRQEIDAAQGRYLSARGRIPPRRWV